MTETAGTIGRPQSLLVVVRLVLAGDRCRGTPSWVVSRSRSLHRPVSVAALEYASWSWPCWATKLKARACSLPRLLCVPQTQTEGSPARCRWCPAELGRVASSAKPLELELGERGGGRGVVVCWMRTRKRGKYGGTRLAAEPGLRVLPQRLKGGGSGKEKKNDTHSSGAKETNERGTTLAQKYRP